MIFARRFEQNEGGCVCLVPELGKSECGLRAGKTPSGVEVRGHLRRLVRRIRRHWPTTRITIRGDGHYCRPEVMDWCEATGVDYVFGLTGTMALAAKVEEVADAVRVERALEDKDVVRGFAETTHAAKSWKRQRRVEL